MARETRRRRPRRSISTGEDLRTFSLGLTVSVLIWWERVLLLSDAAPGFERGSGCTTATGVVPVSLVSCHITSLQNWFLLSALHLNIRLTLLPLLENVSPSGPQQHLLALLTGQRTRLVKFPQP